MNQGSFVVEELTRLVEEAVLAEFDRITARGGVLGAMESGYQRSRIQEESIRYESMKHTGERPIIGVNTFLNPDDRMAATASGIELSRASESEKESQLQRLSAFKKRNEEAASKALALLTQAALSGDNIFAALMDAVRCCTLGKITLALYRIGGRYRRSM